jgi:hypothetical protein
MVRSEARRYIKNAARERAAFYEEKGGVGLATSLSALGMRAPP